MQDEPPTLHSRRTLSLRFNIPISKTHQFWDAISSGRFISTKCSDCGTISFPPQADCPKCMSGNHEWVDLGLDAELVTFTYVQITPTSFVDHDPYVVGIGRLKGGLNVLAWIEGAEPSSLKPGARLRIESRRDKGSNPYYVFVPVS